jgi:peptide/nickel transport system substrate-binding protein
VVISTSFLFLRFRAASSILKGERQPTEQLLIEPCRTIEGIPMEKLYNRCPKELMIQILLMVSIFIVGFHHSAEALDSRKILRMGFARSDFRYLDLHPHFGSQDMACHDMLYDGLLRFKPGDVSVIEPDLAERYQISEDGMELTFYLRKGVMTHPFKGYPEGIEFTSEDVVFSMRKAANTKYSVDANLFKNFVAEAIDKYTVRVRLKERTPNPERALADFCGGHMVPKKAFEIVGAEAFATQPVGTGPFRIIKCIPGQTIVLTAHEKYWRGRPRLDGVEIRLMPGIKSRELDLKQGDLHAIEGLQKQAWVKEMKNMPNTEVEVFGPGEMVFLNFNVTKKPFDNLLVRKAIAFALNRKEMLAMIGSEIVDPMCGQVPPFLPGAFTCEEVAKAGLLYQTNLKMAKAFLRNAGYPKGFSIEQVISEKPGYRQAAENIQAQLKTLGIKLKLKIVDHATYQAQIRKDMNPCVLCICQCPSAGADVLLYNFFHSNSIVGTGKSPTVNFSHCTLVDDLIEKARAETDKEKQIELWKRAQYKLLQHVISYPLYMRKQIWARNSKVKWGYDMKSTFALSPQVNELTDILK